MYGTDTAPYNFIATKKTLETTCCSTLTVLRCNHCGSTVLYCTVFRWNFIKIHWVYHVVNNAVLYCIRYTTTQYYSTVLYIVVHGPVLYCRLLQIKTYCTVLYMIHNVFVLGHEHADKSCRNDTVLYAFPSQCKLYALDTPYCIVL